MTYSKTRKLLEALSSLASPGQPWTPVQDALEELDAGSVATGLQLKYFVLKPDGTDAYAEASRAALVAYADRLTQLRTNPALTTQLAQWAASEAELASEVEASAPPAPVAEWVVYNPGGQIMATTNSAASAQEIAESLSDRHTWGPK